MDFICGLMLTAVLGSTASGPPQQPAAAAAGVEACRTCHEQEARTFGPSTHGALKAFELGGQAAGCESCHGAGEAHAEGGAMSPRSARSRR